MSLRATVTGKIANPVLRWTGKQQAVLEIRIHATASMRDKDTGQWKDVGDPLWVSATFWDQEAEHLSGALNQGDRVSVEGTLVLESYQRRDGQTGMNHSIRSPRFLGVYPRRGDSMPGGSQGGNPGYGAEQPQPSFPTDAQAPF